MKPDYDLIREQFKSAILAQFPDTDKFGEVFRALHKVQHADRSEETEDSECIVGYLKEGSNVSLKGYRNATSETLVFENHSQYIVYLEPEKEGGQRARMTYYKDTLQPHIDFE